MSETFDPTREEMLQTCAEYLGMSVDAMLEGEYALDCEEAIYWFASDWHGGQCTNLYAALCASPFRPGCNSDGPYEASLYSYLSNTYIGE